MVAKEDSNPSSLDCEFGILPLSYRALRNMLSLLGTLPCPFCDGDEVLRGTRSSGGRGPQGDEVLRGTRSSGGRGPQGYEVLRGTRSSGIRGPQGDEVLRGTRSSGVRGP